MKKSILVLVIFSILFSFYSFAIDTKTNFRELRTKIKALAQEYRSKISPLLKERRDLLKNYFKTLSDINAKKSDVDNIIEKLINIQKQLAEISWQYREKALEISKDPRVLKMLFKRLSFNKNHKFKKRRNYQHSNQK